TSIRASIPLLITTFNETAHRLVPFVEKSAGHRAPMNPALSSPRSAGNGFTMKPRRPCRQARSEPKRCCESGGRPSTRRCEECDLVQATARYRGCIPRTHLGRTPAPFFQGAVEGQTAGGLRLGGGAQYSIVSIPSRANVGGHGEP